MRFDEIHTDELVKDIELVINYGMTNEVWKTYIDIVKLTHNFSIPSYELHPSDAEDFRILIRHLYPIIEKEYSKSTQTYMIVKYLSIYLEMWDLVQ
jgi:hypothetical protein